MDADLETAIKRRKLGTDESILPQAKKRNDLPDLHKHNELTKNEKDDSGTLIYAALDHINNDELIDLIEDLLKHRSTGSEKHLCGRTQLYEAIKLNKSVKMIKAMLEYTSNINAKSVNGRTPLHMALCRYNIEVVEELLNHECDVNAKDNSGKTPLHYAFIQEHSIGIIQKLKNAGAYVNAVDCDQKTPFHYMLEHGYDVEDIQKFLEFIIDVNIKDTHGKTPLHYLSQNNDINHSIAIIVADGANINERDHCGRTPLHYMLKKGYSVDIKEMLFLGADIKAVDNRGKSALHYALYESNVEVVHELLNTYMVDVNAKDEYGNTPLHCAASEKQCDLKCIQEILNFGGDVNAKNDSGEYPLCQALAKSRSKEIISVMLKHGASVHNSVNSHVIVQNEDIIKELLKYSFLEHLACNSCVMLYRNGLILIENGINFMRECKIELAKMNKLVIGKQNLYEYVIQKCDYGKCAPKNVDVLLRFKQNPQKLMKIFPIYHDVVMDRMETKTYLLKKFDDLSIFIAVNHKIININSYCVKKIASYLQVPQLNNFYEAICIK